MDCLTTEDSISVIIVTYKRRDLLKRCIDSLLPQLRIDDEVIVGVNGEDHSTTNLLKSYPQIKAVQFTEKLYPSTARNKLSSKTQKDFILFLDDDVELPESYIKMGLDHISKFRSQIFGGPDQTKPKSNIFETSLGLSLSSSIATYKTSARHSRSLDKIYNATERDLILCNMWVKRDVFNSILFSNEYFRNEENVFLTAAKKSKIRISYIGDLFVYHKRKDDLKSLYFAVSRSAFFRMKSIIQNESIESLAFFVPAVFLFYLIILITNFNSINVIPALIFSILNFISTIFTIKKGKDLYLFPFVYFINIFIILSYAIGTVRFILLLLRSRSWKSA